MRLLWKHGGCISLWWGVMMCDVVVLDWTLVARCGTLFYSSISPRQQPSDITAVCFSHEKDHRPCMTRGHIFSAYHPEIPGPAWWCQHALWYGIHSELWYSPAGWLLFLPLWSAACLCPFSIPLSAFIYSVFIAAGLPSSLSALLAVLTVSCGLRGCWAGLHAKLWGDGGSWGQG